VKSSSSIPIGKEDLKKFKEYLRYLYRYGVFFVTYGTSKKE
jgi:hypothetical protein